MTRVATPSLLQGLAAFRREIKEDPETASRYADLTQSHDAKHLFITCSDARVKPGTLTGTKAGELFVLRNAGNLIKPFDPSHISSEQATLEYAVNILHVENIVVCGHSDCGAMKAVVDPSLVRDTPEVYRWIQPVQRHLDPMSAEELQRADLLQRLTEKNAIQQLANLHTHPVVELAVKAEQIQLHAWVYDIGSGVVRGYDEATKQFVDLN